MKDLSKIVDRNVKSLQILIEDLEIDRTIDELVQKCDRIFIHDDNKTSKRLRLLAVERTGEVVVKEEFDKEGNFVGVKETKKRKQIPLYTLKKKDYLKMDLGDKQNLINKFQILIILWKQLRGIYEAEGLEINYEFFKRNNKEFLRQIKFEV